MPDYREQLAEHLKFFAEMGVDGYRRDAVWAARQSTGKSPQSSVESRESTVESPESRVESPESRVESPESTVHSRESTGSGSLEAIREDIGDCVRCKLCTLGRRQIVFGVGNPNADLMFVGEAPGRDEDLQGIPFVGRAGQKLTQIIEAIGLTRDAVYIANVIKCRPPENRNPEPDEVEQCEPFLFRQVDTIKPKVIVALGTFAVKSLLKSTDSISRLRGRVYDYRGAKLVPTFHPAYLLRNPSCRREVWEDMKKVRALLSGEDGPEDVA
jgi:uracil-DNA glycosylase family 4